MPVIRISEHTMERLKKWAEPLTDTADSALSKALDAADVSPSSSAAATTAEPHRRRAGNFIDHLLRMPEVGDDTDFDQPRSEPRVVEL